MPLMYADQARVVGGRRRDAVDDGVVDRDGRAIFDDVVVEAERADDAVIPEEALPVVGLLVLDVFGDRDSC